MGKHVAPPSKATRREELLARASGFREGQGAHRKPAPARPPRRPATPEPVKGR